MSDPKVSLSQQAEAVLFALRRQETLANGGSVKGLRGRSVEEFDLVRLRAAARTIEWLEANEAAIRAFLALPPASREAGLAMAQEVARRETIAKAGGTIGFADVGPVR